MVVQFLRFIRTIPDLFGREQRVCDAMYNITGNIAFKNARAIEMTFQSTEMLKKLIDCYQATGDRELVHHMECVIEQMKAIYTKPTYSGLIKQKEKYY